ncbi:MAG: hypothetical protein ABSH09_29385 [Bryobacteraceae bacterium]
MCRRYRDLYAGGEHFKANATQYLIPRHKEPAEIYYERLGRVFYENYAGSIIDWYAATVFRREPTLVFEGDDLGQDFFSGFVDDCDRKGTSLTDFLKQSYIDVLVGGCSHILIDFPRPQKHVDTRAEEDALGMSRAYLVGYSSDELINWSYDDQGNYEWIVLRTSSLRKKNIADTSWVRHTRWTYYDKRTFQIYDREERGGGGERLELMAQGRHGLSKLDRVPLVDLRVGEGLWLMNRAGLLQLEHFNKSNALGWALTMGLFAQPVVYSDKQFNQIVGESYYIQLAPGDRFGWTEPAGNVFQIASDNLLRLQQEIYRVCYLSQAGGEIAGSGVQSGLSKQRDFSITQEVLRSYGDIIKDTVKRILRWIAEAREDSVRIDVSGLDEFDIGDFSSEISDAQQLLDIGIQSATLRKQIYKKLALKYLCDVRQDIKDQIVREIDAQN